MPAASPDQPKDRTLRYRAMRNVTVWGGVVDLLLGLVKIVVGKLSFSQSLVADGVHSLSDLATDVLVIWAAREASREPDADHPYGHQRIETVATISLGLLLIGVAVAIAWEAVSGLFGPDVRPVPTFWALVVAAVSVVLKEGIYHITMRVANRIDSDLLRSNAWHSRTDALSSVVVIIGVGGSMLGLGYLDAVAAVVVALMIIYVGYKMVWQGVRELIDTGIDIDQLRSIRATAKKIEGVTDIHDLRTRRMGADVYLDGHILVDPGLSVSEGHRIGEAVYSGLKSEFENLADVTIHIDPEDDEAYQRSAHLPLRSELVAQLRDYWRDVPEATSISNIVIHYLDGKLQIEAWLPLDQFQSLDEPRRIRERLAAACSMDPRIRSVKVLFE